MSEAKDPEQLLADALRAQAVFAPQTTPIKLPVPAEEPADSSPAAPTTRLPKPAEAAAGDSLPPQYGLLSGTSADSLERERAALEPATTEVAPIRLPPPA